MHRLSSVLVTFAFAAWLATPLVLIALGADSGFARLEKRRPAKLPEVSATAILDSRLYGELADYFADRVPLRVRAVAIDSWIDLAVFGDSPSPKVLLGADGWLFNRESIMAACGGQASPREVVAMIRRFDRILRASGRRFIFLVAPNKAAIYPQYLGPAAGLAECSRDFRRELRSQLGQAELTDFIDLWEVLEALKGRLDRKIYYPHDTHWTPDAALEVTRQLVERLDPSLWDENRVLTIPGRRHRGDLANMIGLPAYDTTVVHKIRRRGGVTGRRGRSASAEMFPRRVLVIDDSFGKTYRDNLSRFLGDKIIVAWGVSPRHRASMVQRMARAEVVIFEVVERSLAELLGRYWQDLPIRLAAELSGELPVVELDLERVIADVRPSRVLLDLPLAASGVARYLIVDLEAPDRRPAVVAKLPEQGWRNVRSVELSTEAGVRRIGAEIPPNVTIVAIRWGEVRAARLVDVDLK